MWGATRFLRAGSLIVRIMRTFARRYASVKKQVAVRALQLVQQAQASNKKLAMANAEKLAYVQCKAMVHFRTPYEPDVRKRMFQLLTGRGENWWEKNHKSALARI